MSCWVLNEELELSLSEDENVVFIFNRYMIHILKYLLLNSFKSVVLFKKVNLKSIYIMR